MPAGREGPASPWGGCRKGLRWTRRGLKGARIWGEVRTDVHSPSLQRRFFRAEYVASRNVPGMLVLSDSVAECVSQRAAGGRRKTGFVSPGWDRLPGSAVSGLQFGGYGSRGQSTRGRLSPRTRVWEPHRKAGVTEQRMGPARGGPRREDAGARRGPAAQATGVTGRSGAQVSGQNDNERGRSVIILGLPGVTSLRRGQLQAATHGSGVTALQAGALAGAKAPRQDRA